MDKSIGQHDPPLTAVREAKADRGAALLHDLAPKTEDEVMPMGRVWAKRCLLGLIRNGRGERPAIGSMVSFAPIGAEKPL